MVLLVTLDKTVWKVEFILAQVSREKKVVYGVNASNSLWN